MSEPVAAPTDFYAALTPVERFSQLAEVERYRPVPEETVLFLADVVSSTAAIETGHYKQVNVAAAAVIAAVKNALPGRDVAFSFGGDGASFVLPARDEAIGRQALAASVRWVADELDLELRAAAVPVSRIRANGRDLLLARFAVSPALSYAMFAGGGLAWAEAEMKKGNYAVEASARSGLLDLTGLSCRFARLPSQNGTILSLIVVPAAEYGSPDFTRFATELLELAGRRDADIRPVREGAPKIEWTLASFLLETKTAAARKGGRRLGAFLRSAAASAVANFVMRRGRPVGSFDPRRYETEIVRNTDFRKFDDGLRMTLDCSIETADEIETLLAAARARGIVAYGTHRQDSAMLTCFVPSLDASDHVHFVDGAAGGYALAAQALKARQDLVTL